MKKYYINFQYYYILPEIVIFGDNNCNNVRYYYEWAHNASISDPNCIRCGKAESELLGELQECEASGGKTEASPGSNQFTPER